MDDIDIVGEDVPSSPRPPPTASSGAPGSTLASAERLYEAPLWLSNEVDWADLGVGPDASEETREAMMEAMIAEEEFYFGQGTVTLPSAPSQAEPRPVKRGSSELTDGTIRPKKRQKNEPAPTLLSHKVKWTKEEDECLREGIAAHGYGSWKTIATFMKTRTPLQIKNHVRHLTVYGGIKFDGAEEVPASQVETIGPTSVPKNEIEVIKEEVTAAPLVMMMAEAGGEADDADDVDIEITDDEENVPRRAEDRPAFVLQPLSDAEEGSSEEDEQRKDEPRAEISESIAMETIAFEAKRVQTDFEAEPSSPLSEVSKRSSGSRSRSTLTCETVELNAKPICAMDADPLASSHEETAESELLITEITKPLLKEPDTSYANPCTAPPSALLEQISVPSPEAEHTKGHPPDSDGAGELVSLIPAGSFEEAPISFNSAEPYNLSADILDGHPQSLADQLNTTIDRSIIQRHEVSALPEWFLSTLALAQGKKPHPRTLHKTPDRYMKIRNYILAAWDRRKPKYLTKTSVRPGLKGEGDVNAIGRIHDFLESVGAVNVGCPEKSGRKNYGTASKKDKPKGGEDGLDNLTEQEAGSVWNFIEEGQRRKRRIRNAQGDWVDENSDEGFDLAAQMSREELETAREEARLFVQNSKYFADEELERFDKRLLKKRQRAQGGTATGNNGGEPVSDVMGAYDPFRLIPTRSYTATVPAPFRVTVESNALIIMDLHAHLAHTEIIGLLGGIYDETEGVLRVTEVFPCRSMSTGVQCEMDPESEMQARDAFAERGLAVVGWYHSHPTFEPTPSIRDIENQTSYQTLFQRPETGVEPFIGAIVTPYDPRHAADRKSRIGWLSISSEWNSLAEYRLPYACDVEVMGSAELTSDVFGQLATLLREYRSYEHRVDLLKPYSTRHDPIFTRVDKLLHTVEQHANLVTNSRETISPFLTRLREIILKGYCNISDSAAPPVPLTPPAILPPLLGTPVPASPSSAGADLP
ncbi:Myb-like, SWIRM and MPN domains 1 [Thoreauomyces humboldtii]|nr:Myb-like, SWIRM and MPN domains 1 [Thoreauomyces humboldtii]